MIGIVGGMGPLAGTDLLRKITEETNASIDQEHVCSVLFSCPKYMSDRTAFLMGKESINPAFAIYDVLVKLEESGVNTAAIACNTAHAPAIFSVVQKQLKQANSHMKLLNMIDECAGYIKSVLSSKSVGILSTQGTYLSRVYHDNLERLNIHVLELDVRWREIVHHAIYDREYGIKSFSAPIKERALVELYGALDILIDAGAESVVLGCTEIPLAIKERAYRGIPLVDPARVLARVLINEIAPDKLKPDQFPIG